MESKQSDLVLITRPPELARLVEVLRAEAVVAVDTESNSLHAYQEQVCLAQFSTSQTDYLVDSITLANLTPLAEIFANPKIEKVFHAAEYDILCLKRDYGFEFANLFDTMLAARILARPAIGLGDLLEAEFGVILDKRYQRANWGQRPLPPALLDYARLDTHYLVALRERLSTELHQKGLWALAQEDFYRLAKLNNGAMAIDAMNGSAMSGEAGVEVANQRKERPVDVWRISGAYDLEPQQAAVLEELCRYRDQSAQALNRPLFKVMGDRTLLEIAQAAPRNLRVLSLVPGMTQPQMRRHGARLLEAVQRGLRAEPLRPNRLPRPDQRYLDRLEALRQWRKSAAEQMGVASDVVLPRDLLLALAANNPHQPDELAQVMQDSPWRLEHFGSQLLEVLTRRHRDTKVS
jgi:ribonuclease D